MQGYNNLRIHHMLCIPLFVGEGYSDGFSKNMAEKIAWLKANPLEPLMLTKTPDLICEKCPNLKGKTVCISNGNSVMEKDQLLAEALDLKLGTLYTFAELVMHFQEHLTEGIFQNSCQNCQWFGEGLCSYEKYRKSIGQ